MCIAMAVSGELSQPTFDAIFLRIKRHVQRLIESIFTCANQSVINTLLCN